MKTEARSIGHIPWTMGHHFVFMSTIAPAGTSQVSIFPAVVIVNDTKSSDLWEFPLYNPTTYPTFDNAMDFTSPSHVPYLKDGFMAKYYGNRCECTCSDTLSL